MSKLVTISKDTIISALESEPLTAGRFYNIDGCPTCAVGATLRRAGLFVGGFSDVLGSEACGHRYSAAARARLGNWLSALSIVWEHLVASELGRPYLSIDPRTVAVAERLRPDILRWAHDHIPDGYVCTYNPATGAWHHTVVAEDEEDVA